MYNMAEGPANPRLPTSRNVCFTLNAEEGEELRLLDPYDETWKHFKYLVYQREMEGHEHYQGYLEFDASLNYNQIHAFAGLERAALFNRRGTAKQADHYCRKPVSGCLCEHCEKERANPTKLEGPWEHGTMSAQGQRAELLEVKAAIDKGMKMPEVRQNFFHIAAKHDNFFSRYCRDIAPQRDSPPEIWVILGNTGTQKSRWARNRWPDAYWWKGAKWWPKYHNQECVIIDEMYGHKMSFTDLLRLCDRYPFDVETKGGDVEFNSKIICFTSNQEPADWYSDLATHQTDWEHSPLKRRFDEFATIVYLSDIPRRQFAPNFGAMKHTGWSETRNPDTIVPPQIVQVPRTYPYVIWPTPPPDKELWVLPPKPGQEADDPRPADQAFVEDVRTDSIINNNNQFEEFDHSDHSIEEHYRSSDNEDHLIDRDEYWDEDHPDSQ